MTPDMRGRAAAPPARTRIRGVRTLHERCCASSWITRTAKYGRRQRSVQCSDHAALYQITLNEHSEHNRRHEGGHCERAGFAVLRTLKAEEGAEDSRQRECAATREI